LNNESERSERTLGILAGGETQLKGLQSLVEQQGRNSKDASHDLTRTIEDLSSKIDAIFNLSQRVTPEGMDHLSRDYWRSRLLGHGGYWDRITTQREETSEVWNAAKFERRFASMTVRGHLSWMAVELWAIPRRLGPTRHADRILVPCL
jgi:hypothetical protein